MKYEAMDDDVVQPSGSMIPIAIAVLGIVMGTAGLYFGFNANKRLNSIDTSIQNSTTSAAEIEKTVNFFDARIVELENQIVEQAKIVNRLRAYVSQSEQAIKKLTGELNTNRKQIVETAKQVNELKAVSMQIRPALNDPNEQVARAFMNAEGIQKQTETGRTYTIVSGDSFSKIANRFGISLQSVIDANPDADPRRLAIGQKIIIPADN